MASMTKEYDPTRDGPKIPPTPEMPAVVVNTTTAATATAKKTKIATPDLILFDESAVTVEVMTELLFESIGSIELLSISRNDIVNGQEISYNLIANTAAIEKIYNTKKFVRLPGSSEEAFKNFSIRFANHIPTAGTGPLLYYVGDFNSVAGCANYPIINKYTDELVGCVVGYVDAQKEAERLSPPRSIVYSEPETGDIVVDVTNMLSNEKVEIEILEYGQWEDDTIY